MRIKQIFRRALHRRAEASDETTSPVERTRRNVALVIANTHLAAAVSELYQAYGYEVFVPETPVDVIDTLVSVGDRVRAVLISSEATWASGLRELLADEFPRVDRITLVS